MSLSSRSFSQLCSASPSMTATKQAAQGRYPDAAASAPWEKGSGWTCGPLEVLPAGLTLQLQATMFLIPHQALPSLPQLPDSAPPLFNVALFNCQLLYCSLSINDLNNTLANKQRRGDCDLHSEVCYSFISLSCGCFSNLHF